MNGRVGINQREPRALFHVTNGAVLFANEIDNYSGSTPVSGPGTRFMWIPAKNALRAGAVGVDVLEPSKANRWNDANIGNYSWAGGADCEADGEGALVHTNNCIGDGDWSAVFGLDNSTGIGGDWNLVAGQECEVHSARSLAVGWFCSTQGSNANIALGQANRAGIEQISESHGNIALGHSCRAVHMDAFASGYNCHSEGHYAHTLGLNNLSTMQEGYAFGSHIEIDSSLALLLGYRFGDLQRFRPSAPNVIEMTVASTKPTVTIRNLRSRPDKDDPEQDVPDATGCVGINFTKPVNRLEVQGG